MKMNIFFQKNSIQELSKKKRYMDILIFKHENKENVKFYEISNASPFFF